MFFFYGPTNYAMGLYILEPKRKMLNLNVKETNFDSPNQFYIWCCRLGHINERKNHRVS